MSSEKFIVVVLILINFWAVAWAVPALVVAHDDGDNPCQGKDVTNLSLRTYLNVYGIVTLGVVAFLDFLAIAGLFLHSSGLLLFCSTFTILCSAFFHMAWFIVGLVILVRSHSACAEDAPIGQMTIAVLVVQGLGFCMSCGGARIRDA